VILDDETSGWRQFLPSQEREVGADCGAPTRRFACGNRRTRGFEPLPDGARRILQRSPGITYALRAVEIDDTLAEAHAVLAEYHKQLDYNWPAAEREMARAIELNRASPFVRFCNALVVLMPRNHMDEAVAELQAALAADPLSVGTRCWLGIMHLLARQYDRGIDEARRMFELEPTSCWPPFITGIAYRQKYFETITWMTR
jgi:tetratricopeptide (TPR) repeat protein